MPSNESTMKFKADISELRAAMQEAGRQIRLANSEFKAATAGMDDWSKSADGVNAKIKQLNTILTAQKSQLSSLKGQYEAVAAEQGANSKGAEELQIKINNQIAAIEKTEKELSKYDTALEQSADATDDLGDALKESEKDSEKASEGFTVMKGVLADLVASGIKLAISGLKDLGQAALDSYKEFDEGYDNLIRQTGATGEAAKELGENYKNVSKRVVSDMGTIGSAMGEVQTRMGLTGPALEGATEKFIKFADITGTDATRAVELVSRAMGDAGIEIDKYDEVLDDLAKASQASGISVDTLAESLTKYGAPMRALGFDVKESIALFSQWEKSGVNTEIAFSGMKKAIGNWGKEGKDAREEFKKTLEEIAAAPDIADATAKAIEVFGTKAGPDLADAIQGGRFAYQDFLALLEDSSGTVESTYEETQDGYDKMQLAIQGARAEMGSFIRDILDKYEPQITEGIQKATEKLKELIEWAIGHKDEIIAALTTIGGLIGTIFVVEKVSAFKTAVENLIGPLTSVATTSGEAEVATGLLGTAMGALPLLALAGLFGALAVAVAQYTADVKDAAREEYGLTDAQQSMIDRIEAMKQAYDQSKEAQDEANGAIQSEYGYINQLVQEYDSLIDSNGEVKQGYEDRANFILNELSEALGVEREDIEKTIEEHGKLGDSLDAIILKKQAEATLSANEAAYVEAKKNQTEAAVNYQQAIEEAEKAEQAYLETQEAVARAESEKAEAAKIDAGARADANQALYEANAANEEAQKTYEATQQAMKDAEEAYVGYNSTIQNYEGLAESVISGDSEKIQESVNDMLNGFIDAQTGTEETLKKQVDDFEKKYEDLKKAVENGMSGVSEEQVEQARQMVDRSVEELNRFQREAGQTVTDGFAGVEQQMNDAANNVGKYATEAGENYANNLGKTSDKSKKAGKKLADEAVQSMKDAKKKTKSAGEETGGSYASGISSANSEAESAGQSLGNMAVAGVASMYQPMWDAGASNAGSAKNGLESVSTYSSGQNFTQGYINGVKSKANDLYSAVKNIVNQALSTARKTAKEGSPSKLTYQSGQNFTQGYINGVASLQNQLVMTVRNLVGSAVSELSKLTAYNFSEVGNNAADKFMETFRKKSNYTMNRLEYENESKVAEFDAEIEKLTAERDAKTDALQATSDKRVEALEGMMDAELKALQAARDKQDEASKKASDTLKANYDKEVDAVKDQYDANLDAAEKAYQKVRKAYQNKISNTSDKSKKKKLQSELDKIEESYKAQKKAMNKEESEILATLKENYNNQVTERKKIDAAEEKELDEREAAINSNYKAQIEAEKADAKALISANNETYQKLIDTQNKYKAAYQEASQAFLEEYEDALSEYEDKARALVESTINGITDEYDQQYKSLTAKQDALISKFKSATELFEVSGAGVMTISDITAQTESIREYTDKLNKIKNKVSAELFDEIAGFSMKEGSAYIDRLLEMDAADLAAYNQAYTDKLEAANKAADQIYGQDIQNVATAYQSALNTAFQDLPAQLEELGTQAMQGFVDGLTENTDYMITEVQTFIAGMLDEFKKDLKIASPSKVMESLGEFTGEGFGDGLLNMIKYIRGAASSLADVVSTPLGDVLGDISDVRQSVPQTAGIVTGAGSVTNNYNLVQNNTSPKSLSALETYQARRQQIALVKAFA